MHNSEVPVDHTWRSDTGSLGDSVTPNSINSLDLAMTRCGEQGQSHCIHGL